MKLKAVASDFNMCDYFQYLPRQFEAIFEHSQQLTVQMHTNKICNDLDLMLASHQQKLSQINTTMWLIINSSDENVTDDGLTNKHNHYLYTNKSC